MERADTDLHPLGFPHRFVAELIAARADDLAERAAASLVISHPLLAARYAPQPREKWRHSFHGRLHDLAAALAVQSPELFYTQVAWAKVAFTARQAPLDDLRASLETLRPLLADAVSPEDAPLVESYLSGAIGVLETAPATAPCRLSMATPHGRVAAAYLVSILEGDRRAAARVVLRALDGGLGVREAYLDVLVPVQHELGRMWHMGEVNVAEEHFATATTRMVMTQLLPRAEFREPNGRALIAASVEGNTHDLGARMVADFFEMAGWRAVYLGASMPAEDLLTGAHDFNVDLIALSAALPGQLRAAEDAIAALRRGLGPLCPKIIVGGGAFTAAAEAWKALGADGFARGAEEAVVLGERLMAADA